MSTKPFGKKFKASYKGLVAQGDTREEAREKLIDLIWGKSWK